MGVTPERDRVPRRTVKDLSDGAGPFEGFVTGAYREALPVGPFPTSIIWYTDSGKTHKIVEKTIAYTGAFPTTITWKSYDDDGSTVRTTVTDTISYSGAFETNRTRVITES